MSALVLVWDHPHLNPMQLSTDLRPNSDFTRILNDVIFDDRLTHAEFRVWCQLSALPKGAKEITIEADAIAEQLGVAASVFRKHRQALKDKGFLVGDRNKLVVTIPDADFEPEKPMLTEEQRLRNDLKDAWNDSKPDNYPKLRHPLAVAQLETLRLHAEHSGQADLVKFLTAVLKGCKAEDWWKSKALNFNNVFGTGVPKQNKFTNVEKLYKLANSKQGRNALFDVKDDQCWIDWYQAKGHGDMTKVVRLEMDRDDAWIHQVDNEGDGTIYVYNEGERLIHWTYKEGQHGVSYIPTAR